MLRIAVTRPNPETCHPTVIALANLISRRPELLLPVGQTIHNAADSSNLGERLEAAPWEVVTDGTIIDVAQRALFDLYLLDSPSRRNLDERRTGLVHRIVGLIGPRFLRSVSKRPLYEPRIRWTSFEGELRLDADVVFSDRTNDPLLCEVHECKVNLHHALLHDSTGALVTRRGRVYRQLDRMHTFACCPELQCERAVGYATLAVGGPIWQALSKNGFGELFVLDRGDLLEALRHRTSVEA